MENIYADQRGHDVAWMTAGERAELDEAERIDLESIGWPTER